MPCSFAVVCEAAADFQTASVLAERVLRSQIEWLEDVLPDCPIWAELTDGRRYLIWTEIERMATDMELPQIFGGFGEPAQPDARLARRALQLLKAINSKLDGVLLIRDDDRQTARRDGLEQARKLSTLRDRVVIGLAHCKRECWVLAGFDPVNDEERKQLESMRTELGFAPHIDAHELTAKPPHAKRSAKRVLAILTRNDPDRERHCWGSASLETLHQRGEQSGLTAFLTEVRARLVPPLQRTDGRRQG